MLTTIQGDTTALDTPEQWIGNNNINDIINFRLQLVRGKAVVSIKDVQHKLVNKLQEISLSKTSADAEAEFESKPRGVTFNNDHSPFGPSALLKHFSVGNMRWEKNLEKNYYDTDLKAADAVINAYNSGVLVSQIQKTFSVGTMGVEDNRKLVPTKWSLTAVDDIIGKYLLGKVREYPLLETYRICEFEALKNKFIVLLTPTLWQYEWMEAFIHILGKEEIIFGDMEPNSGKKGYSSVGGCYYSVRMAICEHLDRIKKQAGAIVFREAYPGYVPTGVWLCREETRKALEQQPLEYQTLPEVLNYISSKLLLPMSRFRETSKLLKNFTRQTQLVNFVN
jgi:hypothetical protein